MVEREPRVAAHQSGHNSGVVHTGVYYAPGTLRSRTCVAGARLLLDFCAEHGVAADRCGKVIVATREAEVPRLRALLDRGTAAGVADLRLLDGAALQEVEPAATGIAALHVPGCAAVDFSAVCETLAADVARRGGEVRLSTEVGAITPHPAGARVHTDGGPLDCGLAVVCAGLWSDRLAHACGAERDPRIVPFRGDYWRLRPGGPRLRGNVYPVPDPGLPFLGVHASRRVDGEIWVGPSAVLSLSRARYGRGLPDADGLRDVLGDAATWRLMGRHWRAGALELLHDRSRRLVARALSRLLPGVRAADLEPAGCGIRAQAVTRDGRLLDDFVVQRHGAVVHVRNAPSPAATASLAIARHVCDLAGV